MTALDVLAFSSSCFSFAGLALALLRWSDLEFRHLMYGMYAVGNWLGFIFNALDSNIPWAVIDGTIAVIYTWLWWRGRRNGRGKKALKELGAKSRARVEALVRKVTPSPIPSPAGV